MDTMKKKRNLSTILINVIGWTLAAACATTGIYCLIQFIEMLKDAINIILEIIK